MDISSSHSDKEKQALLDKQQRKSNQCHKRCNTVQFVVFSLVIAGLAAVISNVDRIIDKIVGSSSSQDEIAATHCSLGVYEGPNISIPNDWHWGYDADNGPSVWSKYYGQCGCPTSQSPIDIDRGLVLSSMPKQFCSDSNSLLQWNINENYTQKYNGTFEVFHNHHAIVMQSVSDNDQLEPVAVLKNRWQPINSSLHSEFVFRHVHFHWGDRTNQAGLNVGHGNYPLEAHFVHYSADYNSIQDAVGAWKGLHNTNKDRYVLAVVLVFITVDEFSNVSNPVFDKLLNLEVDSSNTEMGYVKQIDLTDLLPDDSQSYYYYSGSLTTPPCDPVVRWHILSTPLVINEVQWEEFQSLAGEVIDYNWRPAQNSNNPVYVCDTNFM